MTTTRPAAAAPAGADQPQQSAADLADRYRRVRQTSDWLREPLSDEDCVVQPMDDASPVRWHLAHTTWFFETFVLKPSLPGYREFDPDFVWLFNSYYNAVGPQWSRPRRGLLTRPGVAEVLAYRAHVDAAMFRLFESATACDPAVITLGLNHEQQHQELIVTDVKYLLACNPLHPVYRTAPAADDGAAPPLRWVDGAEGVVEIGHDGDGFAFDNEAPRHRVYLDRHQLASRPVTCGEYRGFIADGGYRRPELWLSDGWNAVRERRWTAPLYWEEQQGDWWQMTLGGFRPVLDAEPVCHVSYYEADAFARWAGARLPTEAEWESVAAREAVAGNFLDNARFHPQPAPNTPAGRPAQLYGDIWEWTASAYAAYPRYRPALGALGEYNAKFMCNQLVLRGGSCATPRDHIRPTYRNFFPPDARWQFSGIRLARDT